MKTQSTNYGTITGLITDIELSHCHGENTFYKFNLNSCRKSGRMDIVPCIMSTRNLAKIDITRLHITNVKAYGEFRSRNVTEGNKRKLQLYFKVTDIQMDEDSEIVEEDINTIFLNGTLCKVPQYRITPMGRDITDMLIAVNFGNPRANSSYIPLIAWGETAKAAAKKLETGDIINIEGRIQSRPYRKMIGDTYHEMTAYEVSVNKLFIDNGNGGFENIMTGEVQQ